MRVTHWNRALWSHRVLIGTFNWLSCGVTYARDWPFSWRKARLFLLLRIRRSATNGPTLEQKEECGCWSETVWVWLSLHLLGRWPSVSAALSVTKTHGCTFIRLLCCNNKVPQSVGLEQQKWIVSQFWRPDVQSQGVGRVGFFWGLWGKALLLASFFGL